MMPGVAAGLVLLVSVVILDLVDAVPVPSAKDTAQRGTRGAMPPAQQMRFYRHFLLGCLCLSSRQLSLQLGRACQHLRRPARPLLRRGRPRR